MALDLVLGWVYNPSTQAGLTPPGLPRSGANGQLPSSFAPCDWGRGTEDLLPPTLATADLPGYCLLARVEVLPFSPLKLPSERLRRAWTLSSPQR